MKLNELLSKPAELVTENDILGDVIFNDVPINDIFEKIDRTKNVEDLLIVVTNHNYEALAVLTSIEARTFIRHINETIAKKKGRILELTVKDLALNKLLPLKIGKNAVKKDTKIGEVVEMFTKQKRDTLVVVGEKDKYIGKIRRGNLPKRLEILLD